MFYLYFQFLAMARRFNFKLNGYTFRESKSAFSCTPPLLTEEQNRSFVCGVFLLRKDPGCGLPVCIPNAIKQTGNLESSPPSK